VRRPACREPVQEPDQAARQPGFRVQAQEPVPAARQLVCLAQALVRDQVALARAQARCARAPHRRGNSPKFTLYRESARNELHSVKLDERAWSKRSSTPISLSRLKIC
jgi:hypothetical protein